MAQFLKPHGDFKQVAVFDTNEYINDAVTVVGVVASSTTVTVTSISGTATAGMSVQGPAGVAPGATFVSYVAPTLTVSVGGITAAIGTPITLVCKTLYTLGVTVQPQGPKLQMFTVVGAGVAADNLERIMQIVQTRSTVHMFEAVDAGNIAFATYGTEAWVLADLLAALQLDISGITAVNAGATFSG